MARVFLSYAREDAETAHRLAQALGAAGHQVWWDRHIDGGSRFVSEIDRALKDAEAVVVLWSQASVESAWVQDEAVEGRETGRLVPAMLDSSKPPLGFRQFQCVDLSRWSGDSKPVALPELLRAIARTAGEQSSSAQSSTQGTTDGARSQPVVCVLPFTNVSGDAEQEYFSDGISEDIITDLSNVSALSVVSRHTAFSFKGVGGDVKSVAGQLGASHVVEGSVRKAGTRVRISVQLTDGTTGNHLWAERFDRDLTDIFEIQDEISKAIVAVLRLKLLPQERKAIEDRGTSNVEAYELCLMARQYWISGNDGDPRRDEIILRLCWKAVEIDAGYARAWALIALTQSTMKFRDDHLEDDGVAAAERALLLDPTLAEPHCVKAAALARQGLLEEANEEIATAINLDPNSWEVNKEAGYVVYLQGRLEDAAAFFDKAAAVMESDYRSAGFVAGIHKLLGDTEKMRIAARACLARAEAALAQDRSNGAALAWGVASLGQLGEIDRAREWARRALLVDSENLIMRYNLACAFAGDLADTDAALDVLEPWFATATPYELKHLAIDRDMVPIRDHERFQHMMQEAAARTGAKV